MVVGVSSVILCPSQGSGTCTNLVYGYLGISARGWAVKPKLVISTQVTANQVMESILEP